MIELRAGTDHGALHHDRVFHDRAVLHGDAAEQTLREDDVFGVSSNLT